MTAFIWGTTFVAQSAGGDIIGPYTFNCIRTLIGGFVLLPVIALFDRLGWSRRKPVTKASKWLLLRGGLISGITLGMKFAKPETKIVGISQEPAAVMIESLKAGHPIEMPEEPIGGG